MALFPRIPAREHDKFVEDVRDAGTDVRSAVGIVTTTQAAAVDDDDVVMLSVSPHGEVYLASHDYTTQSDRVAEVDPIPEKYEYSTIATGTSIATGTAYSYYIPMAGYTRLDLQFSISAGELDPIFVYGSMQADGTAPASLSYFDIGSTVFDGYVSSIISTINGVFLDTTKSAGAFNYIRLDVTTSGTTTFAIYAKKQWQ